MSSKVKIFTWLFITHVRRKLKIKDLYYIAGEQWARTPDRQEQNFMSCIRNCFWHFNTIVNIIIIAYRKWTKNIYIMKRKSWNQTHLSSMWKQTFILVRFFFTKWLPKFVLENYFLVMWTLWNIYMEVSLHISWFWICIRISDFVPSCSAFCCKKSLL